MIIYRYLTKEVCITLLATTLILLLVFVSNQFVRYLQFAASGMIPTNVVVLILLLQMPNLLAIVLPASLFISILLVYGKLYVDNEMTVLAACGVGPRIILRKTMEFSLIVALVVALLSFWIAPKLSRYADQIFKGRAFSSLELLVPNRFQAFNQGKWVYYVDKASNDKTKLQRVFAAQQSDDVSGSKDKPSGIIFAESGKKIVDEKGNTFLVLNNGYRYIGIPGRSAYQITKYDQYGVNLQQSSGSNWQPDESNTDTLELWNMRNKPLATAELQWRMALPISVLVLAFLSVPLSRIRPRQGRYAQLAPAILFYIAYAQLLFLSRAWLKKELVSPIIGMWWVHILMLALILFIYFSRGYLRIKK